MDEEHGLDSLGVTIRLYRLALGLSVEDVARHVGCDVAHLVAVEGGAALPTMAELERLGVLLNVNPDQLLYRGPPM
jgi:transcriptional regulator with XRE-family HTH domain